MRLLSFIIGKIDLFLLKERHTLKCCAIFVD